MSRSILYLWECFAIGTFYPTKSLIRKGLILSFLSLFLSHSLSTLSILSLSKRINSLKLSDLSTCACSVSLSGLKDAIKTVVPKAFRSNSKNI